MEISQSPAPKGKKRARSPEDSSSTLHVSKRTSSTRSWGLNSEETSSQKTANAAPQPAAIRALIEAAPPVFSLPSTVEVDTSEQFVPRTFAAHFGSGASGSWCGWNPTRRLKSFRSGVGNNQILRASNNLQPFRPVSPCSTGILLELPGCNDYRRPSKDQEQDHHYTAFVQPGRTNWLYCGEYRLVDKGDIAWAELPSWVRKLPSQNEPRLNSLGPKEVG
ncbi:hypothetical protein M408DRAFT_177192 [Serendipita vermifera MAFF 305830]|uniref:DUF6697 domain-containing protein n=1 Tax=Serendipita vermifera MAFF 305830 TaxID=933852 RepID=A0A0C2WK90_SERVB|nr:hypothetical protein M408DRAFT_177192 [Serendipita vermifera MAFF 305830]